MIQSSSHSDDEVIHDTREKVRMTLYEISTVKSSFVDTHVWLLPLLRHIDQTVVEVSITCCLRKLKNIVR